MTLFRRRHAELDAQVDDARKRAEEAEQEVEVSRERREKILTQVVAPLREAAQHNQFAELLRETLVSGYRDGNHHRKQA